MRTYEERIREIRSDLSPSFQVLADFLLDSYSSAAFLTATELAYSLDLDPATVVRFAQRLDYGGYPELQREIRQRVKEELLTGRPAEVTSSEQAADAALEEVERYLQLTRRSFPIEAAEILVNALDEAERVVLIAEGLGVGPARSLGAWLESAGYTVQLGVGGLGEIARALVGGHRKDIAIAVEVEDQAPVVARALAEARRAGLRTAALVAAPSAQSTNHADYVLAGHASPDAGVGQVVVEAIVYAIVQLLRRNRPGRFSKIQGEVGEMRQRIAGDSR
ncbi:MAG: MurR/RpiR family transcriptional regulator [Anaerolineales bacterium]